jgi:hypothetical protein
MLMAVEARKVWRRGWDSNPRSSYPDSSFRDCPIRPLSHLSDIDDRYMMNREQVGCRLNAFRQSLPWHLAFCNA